MKTFYYGHSKKSGVYKLINTKNNRIYIGSAKCFKDRYYGHLKSLKNNKHHNKFLQNDFNKCGEDAFEFHVVEVVKGRQDKRLLVEQKYLDQFHDDQKHCYNFKPKSKQKERSCFSKTPEETSKLISKNMKHLWQEPQYKLKMKNRRYVKKHSKETREKMSKSAKERGFTQEQRNKITKALIGRKNGPHTQEAKLKMSKNRRSKGKIVVINKNTGEILEFHSQGFCAKYFNVSTTTISNLIKFPSRKGYKGLNDWKFER